MTLFNPFALMIVREMSIYIFAEKSLDQVFPLVKTVQWDQHLFEDSNVYLLDIIVKNFLDMTTRLKRLLVSTVVQ